MLSIQTPSCFCPPSWIPQVTTIKANQGGHSHSYHDNQLPTSLTLPNSRIVTITNLCSVWVQDMRDSVQTITGTTIQSGLIVWWTVRSLWAPCCTVDYISHTTYLTCLFRPRKQSPHAMYFHPSWFDWMAQKPQQTPTVGLNTTIFFIRCREKWRWLGLDVKLTNHKTQWQNVIDIINWLHVMETSLRMEALLIRLCALSFSSPLIFQETLRGNWLRQGICLLLSTRGDRVMVSHQWQGPLSESETHSEANCLKILEDEPNCYSERFTERILLTFLHFSAVFFITSTLS